MHIFAKCAGFTIQSANLAPPHDACENPDMDSPRIVYYHYFRHHREPHASYDVTELEEAAARAIAYRLQDVMCQPVTHLVEHFQILPETGSKYLQLLADNQPTIVVMQDMRMFVQTAGVKGMRLLRKSIEAQTVPVTISEVYERGRIEFPDQWQRSADVILPLTDHIGDVLPHGTGRQRTDEITSLMRSAFDLMHRGQITNRDTLLDYLRYEVEMRFAGSNRTIALFEPTSWRTYQYKVRRRIEEMIAKTYILLAGTDESIRPDSVWAREAYEHGQSIPLPAFVAEACIRQLDND